jgi:membrane associated rhomboid family serine protease
MLIGANVAMFFVQLAPVVTEILGLRPIFVVGNLWVWQLVTYMFLHGSPFHLLFNMLALWMFGGELERVWGVRYFLKFYFVTGVGAGILTVLFSLLPFDVARDLYGSNVIGASGAIYGLLLAFGLYFPDRLILLVIFPVQAKIAVLIMGAVAFYSSVSGINGGVASATHLGGLLVGYIYLKGPGTRPLDELKYRYLRWKMSRVRRKFDVYSGGKPDDWNRRIH